MRLDRDVAPGVHRVEEFAVNWYLVEDGSALTVVDAGLPRSWGTLQGVLGELGRSPSDVEALVLTHAHPDHVGFAERLRTEWGVHVWVHERDRSLSRHPMHYEKEHSPVRHLASPDALKALAGFVRAGVLSTRPLREVRGFADETALDVPGRPCPVHVPGHTHGSVALHLPDRGVVLTGDALVTHDPYVSRRGPRVISGAACADRVEAVASLQRLAETAAGVLLPGHGEPWTGGAEEAVARAREAGAG